MDRAVKRINKRENPLSGEKKPLNETVSHTAQWKPRDKKLMLERYEDVREDILPGLKVTKGIILKSRAGNGSQEERMQESLVQEKESKTRRAVNRGPQSPRA